MRAHREDGVSGAAMQVVHSTPHPRISTVPMTASTGTQVRAKLARLGARPSRRRLLPARAGQEDAGGDAQLLRRVPGNLRRRGMVGGGQAGQLLLDLSRRLQHVRQVIGGRRVGKGAQQVEVLLDADQAGRRLHKGLLAALLVGVVAAAVFYGTGR